MVAQKKDSWQRVEYTLDSDGSINSSALQSTFTNNSITIPMGTNNSGEISPDGTTYASTKNTDHKLRINGAEIELTVDGGTTWTKLFVLYEDNGEVKISFNPDYMTLGRLDITKLNLIGGDTNFVWNTTGLIAKNAGTPTTHNITFNKDGLKATNDGGVTYTFNLSSNGSLTLTGTVSLPNAGMTNEGSSGSSTRIWAGDTYANRDSAPFRVDQDGNVYAETGYFKGTVGTTDDITYYIKDVTSSFTTSFGGNADIRFMSAINGITGDSISITMTAGGSLSINVSSFDITITFISGVTTANDIITEIESNVSASVLIFADLASGSNGTGAVSALTKTYLSGYSQGRDIIGDGTSGNPFKTISHALSIIPKTINNTVTLNIVDGSLLGSIEISDFIGNGFLTVINSFDTYTKFYSICIHDIGVDFEWFNGKVYGYETIDGNNNGLSIYNSYGKNEIYGLIIYIISTGGSAEDNAVYISSNTYVDIQSCILKDYMYGIDVIAGSNVYSVNNTGENDYGLGAFSVSTIGKFGTQPTGTVSNEQTASGGEIR